MRAVHYVILILTIYLGETGVVSAEDRITINSTNAELIHYFSEYIRKKTENINFNEHTYDGTIVKRDDSTITVIFRNNITYLPNEGNNYIYSVLCMLDTDLNANDYAPTRLYSIHRPSDKGSYENNFLEPTEKGRQIIDRFKKELTSRNIEIQKEIEYLITENEESYDMKFITPNRDANVMYSISKDTGIFKMSHRHMLQRF